MTLNKWVDYTQSNLFFNQDGFFELPYLSNSPQLMVESLANIPIVLHKTKEQAIYTDNSLSMGVMRYLEIEEGFWLVGTDIQFKQNIISKAFYDSNEPNDYYFLSFSIFENLYPTNDTLTEMSALSSTNCTFYKPKTEVATYFYKDSKGKFFNLVFTKKWVENNLRFKTLAEEKSMLHLLNGDTGFINWLDIIPDAYNLSNELWQNLENGKREHFETMALKNQTTKIITDFFKSLFEAKTIKNYLPLNNADYANVARAEKTILQNLNNPFLGVENIAKEVNLSPTKLKMIFKSVYGFSMLQYHKEKNMLLAFQLVKNAELQIKNIAHTTGFESSSKFTAAFKKRFGMLPSDARNP
jgi:AraC-like DNA-binding protein